MSELVGYELKDGVAWLSLDDGKANALSLAMSTAIGAALDRAAAEAAARCLALDGAAYAGTKARLRGTFSERCK